VGIEDERFAVHQQLTAIAESIESQERTIAKLSERVAAMESRLPTHEELADLRASLKEKDRRTWLIGGMRTWATWLAAIIAAVGLSWGTLKAIIKEAIG
jgi:ABC-type Fe3+-citrate transport system substrate-binding protein